MDEPKTEILERVYKDELLYGDAFINPEKDDPVLDPRHVEIKDHSNWVIIDGFLKESSVWIKKP